MPLALDMLRINDIDTELSQISVDQTDFYKTSTL